MSVDRSSLVFALAVAVCPRAYAQDGRHRGAAARADRAGRESGDTAAYLALLIDPAPTASGRSRLLQLGAAAGRDAHGGEGTRSRAAARHARRQRLPADGGRPHRVRPPRTRRHLAAGHQARRRARQRPGMGHRRRRAPVVGREPLSPRAEPGESVRGPRPEGRRRGSRPHAHRGLRVRRRHRPGRDRRRAGRPRHDELSPDAGNRTRSGQDLCGQRDARDALRRRIHPPQSVRLRVGARVIAAETRRWRTRRNSGARRKSFAKTRRSPSRSTSAT